MSVAHRACYSGKRRFHDLAEAKKALTVIRQTGVVRDVMPTRVYRCSACGGWHLTSWVSVPLRRSPLERRAALKAKTGLKRGKGLKRVSDGRRSEADERAKVRGDVFLRDGFRCQIAPLVPEIPCFGILTPHHLKKASAGGSYTADNLVAACVRHNDLMEDDPPLARAIGMVR